MAPPETHAPHLRPGPPHGGKSIHGTRMQTSPPPYGKGEQTPSLPGTSGAPGMTLSEGGGWSDRGAWARKTPRDAPTPATP